MGKLVFIAALLIGPWCADRFYNEGRAGQTAWRTALNAGSAALADSEDWVGFLP